MGDCRDKALDLVARRPHFRAELEHKLSLRGFSTAEIESALEGLTQAGLVDDLSFARDLAAGPMTRKDFGPRRIRAELARRGVEESIVDQVVSETFSQPDEELRRARQAASKRAGAAGGDAARLGRYLDRTGFSKSVILRVLEEMSLS